MTLLQQPLPPNSRNHSPSAPRHSRPSSHPSTPVSGNNNNTPGIININPNSNSNSPRTQNRSRNRQRKPKAIPIPPPTSDASTPIVIAPVTIRSSSKHTTSSNGPAASSDSNVDGGTPVSATKNRRRTRPPRRQPSPPEHSSSDEIALPKPTMATEEVDQRANDPAMSLLSRSAPALSSSFPASPFTSIGSKIPRSTTTSATTSHGQQHHHHHPLFHASSLGDFEDDDDSWEMPTSTPASAGAKLTWQQEEQLRHSSSGSMSGTGTPVRQHARSRTDSNIRGNNATTRSSRGSGNNARDQARPSLNGSISDTPSSSSTGGLTWQQALLQQSSSSHLHHHNSSSSNSLNHQSPTPSSRPPSSPQKNNRRNQQRDYETFGVSSLSLEPSPSFSGSNSPGGAAMFFPFDDVFSSSNASSPSASPSKVGAAISAARYAGPTFHNSPLASSLPMPSFMKRRLALA